MDIVNPELEEYAFVHSSREDPLLRELVEETQANTAMPQMQTGHLEGSLLRMLTSLCRTRHALEIGTFTGYSALCIAASLPEDGILATCDADPDATAIAKRYWARSLHGHKIDLHLGDALETLKDLKGPFEFAFIDADKENYVNYWEAILPMMAPGGLVCVDNVLWGGRVLSPEEPTDKAIVAFNEHARYDDRVELVMLTIRDGLTVARVKS